MQLLKYLMEKNAIGAAELIIEWYNICEFAVNVWMFNHHQQKDKELQEQMTKE